MVQQVIHEWNSSFMLMKLESNMFSTSTLNIIKGFVILIRSHSMAWLIYHTQLLYIDIYP